MASNVMPFVALASKSVLDEAGSRSTSEVYLVVSSGRLSGEKCGVELTSRTAILELSDMVKYVSRLCECFYAVDTVK